VVVARVRGSKLYKARLRARYGQDGRLVEIDSGRRKIQFVYSGSDLSRIVYGDLGALEIHLTPGGDIAGTEVSPTARWTRSPSSLQEQLSRELFRWNEILAPAGLDLSASGHVDFLPWNRRADHFACGCANYPN
jgi:hypothetical protein